MPLREAVPVGDPFTADLTQAIHYLFLLACPPMRGARLRPLEGPMDRGRDTGADLGSGVCAVFVGA